MTENVTIEEYAPGTDTPQLVDSRTVAVPLSGQTVDLRSIKADWKTARANAINANQALQAASTNAQVTAAVKNVGTAYLQAFRVMERAMKYLDNELADLTENGA